jgi:hypothetical protein
MVATEIKGRGVGAGAVGAAAARQLDEWRLRFWPLEVPWRGAGSGERGWFSAPRTLPLVLALLGKLRGLTRNRDVGPVYVELLARQMGQGVVRMGDERMHAYAAGYTGPRAVRSWLERMKILEDIGFIRAKPLSGLPYGLVLVVHPSIGIARLFRSGRLPQEDWVQEWWETYRVRQDEAKEAPADALETPSEGTGSGTPPGAA